MVHDLINKLDMILDEKASVDNVLWYRGVPYPIETYSRMIITLQNTEYTDE